MDRFICLQTVTHPSINPLIVTRLEDELMTSKSNVLTIMVISHLE